MNIIPYPKKIKEYDRIIKYRTFEKKPQVSDERISAALDKLTYSEGGAPLSINIGNGTGEEYKLGISEEGAVIDACSVKGAFYAIQTLRQILENETVYCTEIEDKPDFEVRGFYHDITRGKVPTVHTLENLIDDMAYYKLNSLQLYVEHVFPFKEFADSIERTGYITAQELHELDRYCADRFIEFVPSLSTFGHLYELLEKPQYKHLREAEPDNTLAWENRMAHHTIDPTSDESFEVVKSLIDQYMPCFSSDKFNICCDETFDLKNGRHKDMDTAKLYVDFVCKIINYVKSKGKKVMMWADILLQHPEVIDKVPEDTILLNWDYDKAPDEKNAKLLSEMKRTQILCPGTWSWLRLCEDVNLADDNIAKMAEYAYKYGAGGLLNTNWGDWGNPCSIELAMHGMLLGADKSWNVHADADFDDRINAVLYKSKGAEYIKAMSDIEATDDFRKLAMVYANITLSAGKKIDYTGMDTLKSNIAESLKLKEKISQDSKLAPQYKEEMLNIAEGFAVVCELLAVYAGYDIVRKTDTKAWLAKYSELWLKKNKPSELCQMQKMFTVLEDNINKK